MRLDSLSNTGTIHSFIQAFIKSLQHGSDGLKNSNALLSSDMGEIFKSAKFFMRVINAMKKIKQGGVLESDDGSTNLGAIQENLPQESDISIET